MTRERANELKEVFNAFCEGKEIQSTDINNEWEDCSDPEWFDSHGYRIKPTEEYRPYKDCDEMLKDYMARFNTICPAHAMPLIWVRDENATSLITDFGVNGDNERICLGAENYDMQELFNDFTYLDGSPIGVKE